MLDDIAAKLAEGERLNDADAQALARTRDIVTLGMLADEVRRKRHDGRATFVRVLDIPLDAAAALARDLPRTAGEFRLTGTPRSLEAAVAAVRQIVAVAAGIPVTGFSLADLESGVGGVDAAGALARLRDAGLESVAEAPLDRLHNPRRALEQVAGAGLVVARVTVDRPATGDRLSILRTLVALQDALGSLHSFAPLARQPSAAQPSTGYDDVKQVALARLLADNIASIQVDWALYGPKLAQVALTFGADDLDGVAPTDDESLGWRRAPLEEIRRNIRAASLTPVERNGRFEIASQ